ncbi:MAG: hypothetical protein ACTSWC_02950, partial [Promethearchaeota archaeon]
NKCYLLVLFNNSEYFRHEFKDSVVQNVPQISIDMGYFSGRSQFRLSENPLFFCTTHSICRFRREPNGRLRIPVRILD